MLRYLLVMKSYLLARCIILEDLDTRAPPATIRIRGGSFDKNYGHFVKVDGAFWSKKVAPFVGEWTLVININRVLALNPLHHYCPKAYKTINTFEGMLSVMGQHVAALKDLIHQYMSGLDALDQLHGLWTQSEHIHKYLNQDEGVTEQSDNNESKDYGVDEVAEGEPVMNL
ncbi:hypothetical protein IW262DRAFT_1301496 [Armillaria fumosa]|nr:hypothetical protein IW262DRAFT_1301496 [Armillaria fumosa]